MSGHSSHYVAAGQTGSTRAALEAVISGKMRPDALFGESRAEEPGLGPGNPAGASLKDAVLGRTAADDLGDADPFVGQSGRSESAASAPPITLVASLPLENTSSTAKAAQQIVPNRNTVVISSRSTPPTLRSRFGTGCE